MEDNKKTKAVPEDTKKVPLMEDHMQSVEVRTGARIFGWVVVVLLILGAFVAGYFVNASMQRSGQQMRQSTDATPVASSELAEEKLQDVYLGTGEVAWEVTPKEVPVTFFTANTDPERPHRQWLVGRVTGESSWKGADVLLVRGNALETDGNPVFLRVLRLNGKHFVVSKHSNEYVGVGLGEGFALVEHAEKWHVAPGTAWAENLTLEELSIEPELRATKEKLVFAKSGNTPFESWSPFTPLPEEGMAWFGDEAAYEPAMQVTVRRQGGLVPVQLYKEKKVTTGDFYLRLPDGTFLSYHLVLPFKFERPVEGRTAAIIWNNGTHNTQGYGEYQAGGCGFTSLRISDGYSLVNNPEFKLAGKVTPGFEGGGDSRIYEYRDTNHADLKAMYESERAAYEYRHPDEKLTYEGFLAMHPMIFWSDPFGRVFELHSDEFLPVAECGKPVIYLYPEQTQKVNVQVQPAGGFSVTEPLYPTGGWNVVAEPSGRLTDTRDNKNWSYLFWEGQGSVVGTPETRGFVVARAEVPAFLERTLTSLGLNTQERKDFAEFWVPRMQRAPYYFVTFYGNELMNRIAPLRVTPRPDSVIRVLMDYQPLMEQKVVEPLPITTPARDGFTVVEWGGVLHN